MNREENIFPFSAVVAQDQVKLALLLNAVSHQVGGVLIRGRRGTAKSTLSRALADLLPEIDVVHDCPFSCDPGDIESLCGFCAGTLAVQGVLPATRSKMKLVTLPLNATEEMVVGTLDIEKALRQGERSFEPGILARANRSILYVDEVNLLEDHLVDVLLDSAAMGVNVVEREGISFRHGASFILVGTMNPEEGDLRPQLEDRFGLCAEVDEVFDAEARAEVLRRSLQFSRNPLELESRFNGEQELLRSKISAARARYPHVEVDEGILSAVASIVEKSGADGLRADIAIMNSSRALAAFEEREKVCLDDVGRVAALALNHRVRRGSGIVDEGDRLDIPSLIKALTAAEQKSLPGFGSNDPPGAEESPAPAAEAADAEGPPEGGAVFDEITLQEAGSQSGTAGGKRGVRRTADSPRGRYYRSATPEGSRHLDASDVAIDATIRSAAARGAAEGGRPDVQPEDVRVKLRKRKCGSSILFVVDASASMGAKKRLDSAREAILALLVEAYQKRDRVGLVVFKDDSAQLVMSPTSSPTLAGRLLAELSPGGTTPLAHGLVMGYQVLGREMSRVPAPTPFMVLISDGAGNVTLGSSDPLREALEVAASIRERGIRSIVLDSAPRPQGSPLAGRPTAAKRIAEALEGAYYPARNLSPDTILDGLAASSAREPSGAN